MADERVILVAAGGDQTRWDGPGSKHMVDMDGEPLLARTMGQIGHGDPVFLLAWHPEIVARFPAAFMPRDNRYLMESVVSVRPIWKGQRLVIILGDVVFTQETMDRVLAYDGALAVFGDDQELFAASLDTRDPNRLRQVTDAMRHAVQAALLFGQGRGQMWDFYRVLAGFKPGKHQLEEDIFHRVTDETTDYDCWGDVLAYRAGLERQRC